MELVEHQSYRVTVIRTVPSGVVVRLEDDSTELIHLSNVSKQFVKDPLDYVDIDGSYDAECIIGFNGKLQLSLKSLNLTRQIKQSVPKVNTECEAHRLVTRSPKHTPVAAQRASLDDMISHSNKQYQDKMYGRRKKSSKSKK